VAWRGLHLTKPSRLSLADGQIVVGQDDGEVRLPVEDIAWVVIDSPRTSLTASLMSACMDAGVAVIFTDATHTPSGVALPFHRHHRQADVAARQAKATAPTRKRLWQAIVRRKIENQAAALDAVGRGGGQTLRAMAQRVGSGDTGNVEARAARYYWGQFWDRFRREDGGDRRNKLINYGYAVARSGVARSLVASGLIPAFGLKHASVSNAFNLADDLFEPFRPFVDVLAWGTVGAGEPCREDMSVEDRRAMAGVLLREARIGPDAVTLLSAAERAAESLVRALDGGGAAALLLPLLNPETAARAVESAGDAGR
jgi:CRISP-associated protein Cas1